MFVDGATVLRAEVGGPHGGIGGDQTSVGWASVAAGGSPVKLNEDAL